LVLAAILVWQRSGPAKKAADQASYRVSPAISRLSANGTYRTEPLSPISRVREQDQRPWPKTHAVTNPFRPNRRGSAVPTKPNQWFGTHAEDWRQPSWQLPTCYMIGLPRPGSFRHGPGGRMDLTGTVDLESGELVALCNALEPRIARRRWDAIEQGGVDEDNRPDRPGG
jgi:hypothetical protein